MSRPRHAAADHRPGPGIAILPQEPGSLARLDLITRPELRALKHIEILRALTRRRGQHDNDPRLVTGDRTLPRGTMPGQGIYIDPRGQQAHRLFIGSVDDVRLRHRPQRIVLRSPAYDLGAIKLEPVSRRQALGDALGRCPKQL